MIKNIIDRLFRRQKTMRELNRLTDQQLADIGLHRSQIPCVVKGTFEQYKNFR